MVKLPFATEQVGCVTLPIVGVVGVTGCAFTVTLTAALVHPLALAVIV